MAGEGDESGNGSRNEGTEPEKADICNDEIGKNSIEKIIKYGDAGTNNKIAKGVVVRLRGFSRLSICRCFGFLLVHMIIIA